MMSTTSSSCSLVPLVQSLQFKSGSLSKPSTSNDPSALDLLHDAGHGVFEWPSGLRYVGEYLARKRHGYGVQLWPDGAKYEGHFHEDQRQGKGKHSWGNGEEYEGEYQGDRKHGSGVYRWPSGAYISGQFYQDCKEGLCVYVSADGEKFEGVYHGDERDGEGVLTYPGGRQDVGTWKGTKLVKLRFTVKESYFDPASCDHPLKSPDSTSLGSPDFKERGKFGPKGPLEVVSEELIQAASCGEVAKVTSVLKIGAVHVDVADKNGHTALFAASVHSHPEVVNVLLDNGADVNKLDSVGVTALNACHHILYCSLPQMKVLLKRLPRLEYPELPPSPPHSTTLTDCTLHTSDFLSTPHSNTSHLHKSHPHILPPHASHPNGISPTCSECQGICEKHKAISHTEEDIENFPAVHSYPLIPSSDQTAQVSQSSIVKEAHRRPSSAGDAEVRGKKQLSLMEVTQVMTHQLALTSTVNPLAVVRHTAQDSSSPVPMDTPSSSPVPMDTPSRPFTSEREDTRLTSAMGPSEAGYSVTASANGDIFGVSAISPDFYSSSEARFPDDNLSRVSLPRQESDLSQESLSDLSLTETEIVLNVSTPKPHNPIEPLASTLPFTTVSNKPNPLYLMPSPGTNSPLHSSSVFSSTQYGPIVSAAQSTTLSCGSITLDDSSTPSDHFMSGELDQRCPTPEVAIISLLLRRGADPNESSLPLSPLVYAIRSGDSGAVQRLIERGANVNHPLPSEVGGHSPLIEAISLEGSNPVPIIESLIKHGAHVNITPPSNRVNSLSADKREPEKPSTTKADSAAVKCKETVVLAGENQGERQYTPLHWACSHRDHPKVRQEDLFSKVLAIVDLLLGGGADVDVVARGHSPLSLAIINGHDKVVEKLLSQGADPNLPLGRGVGTALCSLIIHSALKKRDATSSIRLVGQLLQHGANFTQPVKVTGHLTPGTVADFAHVTFKEDKRLSCLKYSALSKSERARYLAWKKLINNFVNLFKCRALHAISLRESAWLQVQIDQQVDNRLQIRRERLLRTSSVIHMKQSVTHKRSRVHSAGGVPAKTTSKTEILPSFPLLTLKTAVRKVTKHHGPTLNGGLNESEEDVVGTTNGKVQEKRLLQLKELFDLATDMFSVDAQADDSCISRASAHNSDEYTDGANHQQRDDKFDSDSTRQKLADTQSSTPTRQTPQWTLSCFCYECGQSSGVHLVRCPGCQYVYYCSQTCRVENYRRGHREECSGGFVKQTSKVTKPSTGRQIRSANI